MKHRASVAELAERRARADDDGVQYDDAGKRARRRGGTVRGRPLDEVEDVALTGDELREADA